MKKYIMMLLMMMPLVSNATVGILDGPIDCDHKEFKRCNAWRQIPVVQTSHHGSHVASIVGGKTVGVNKNAKIVGYQVYYMNDLWSGSWISDANEESAVVHGKTTQGVTVFNQSYGYWGAIYSDETGLWNRHQDVVFVKAGGNEGVVVNAHGLPIGSNVILVGAVDSNNNIPSWSNKPGHALKHHWVMAPGVGIRGAMAGNRNGYLHMSGTSMSAPYVTGVVSILHDRYPQLRHNPAGTKNIILTTATDLGPRGVDATYGWGLVNKKRAILTAGARFYVPPTVVSEKDAPYIRTEAGGHRFAFQFVPNENGDVSFTSLRYNFTPELSLGYLLDDHNYSPSVNFTKAGLSVTMAYTKIDDQPEVYYSPMLSASASYFKSFEITKKTNLEFSANIPMFTFDGYSSWDDEVINYEQDPDYKIWLRWKGIF
jgi:hypothetical protein